MSITEPAVATHTNGAPETALFGAGFTDIAKWMRVSTYQSAGSSHAKLFDEQAVMEATLNLATAALIGGNMISNVGCLNADQTCSMTQMVASDEIIDMLKHILRGIPVNDDTMALDVIEDVGPGKHFLTHKHTRGRFEKELWRPKLMDRKRWSTWSKGGAKRYGQRAQERVRDILATETEALLEEAMYKELRRICELADARHQ